MASEDLVPVWALATQEVSLPTLLEAEGMTPARLSELRTVLAAMAGSPIATLEAYTTFAKRDKTAGIALNATSPLAQQLARLIADTAKAAPAKLDVGASGEVLYRMVVPAKVAAEFGKGLVAPVASKVAKGGIYSMIRSPGVRGAVANATFVPVAGKAAVAGAAAGSAATVGVGATATAAAVAAAPLVLMAVAVGVSAYAEHQRQEAIDRITDLLEELHDAALEKERNELDGSRDAITKATSILLDQGKIGFALGLDSSAYAINTAIESARRRLKKWESALSALPEGPVLVSAIAAAFPGITEDGGKFRAQMEIARLAIALKRRVLVLQAVEHAQLEGTANTFESFVGTLKDDERHVEELESGITRVLMTLSTLELKRQGGLRSPVFTQGEVDTLLRSVYRLRALGELVSFGSRRADVAIDIERSKDGSLVVFPAVEV